MGKKIGHLAPEPRSEHPHLLTDVCGREMEFWLKQTDSAPFYRKAVRRSFSRLQPFKNHVPESVEMELRRTEDEKLVDWVNLVSHKVIVVVFTS
jgi:hypothetical protein